MHGTPEARRRGAVRARDTVGYRAAAGRVKLVSKGAAPEIDAFITKERRERFRRLQMDGWSTHGDSRVIQSRAVRQVSTPGNIPAAMPKHRQD